MDTILFRRLDRDDINRFVELRKAQLCEERAGEAVDLTSFLIDFYQKHLRDGTFLSQVAVDGEKIIATSGLSLVERPPYHGNPTGQVGIVSGMYTLPAYRRRGIAKKLLELVLAEAREQGCNVMQITASEAGKPFYRDFGFTQQDNFFQYKFE